MTRAWIACAVLLLFLAALAWTRWAPPVVNIADVGVTELYVDLASHARLLDGPYSRFRWHHPGPLYFYLQAPLYAAAGQSGAALFAGAWALNIAAFGVLLSILAGERRAGLTVGVGTTMLVFAWRVPDILASPWTAHVPILPFLTLAAAAAAIAAGRTRLLPTAVFIASFVVQTDLALAPAVAVMFVLLTPAIVRAVRSPATSYGHMILAGVIALVAWLPPIVEMSRNGGGNVAALWTFFGREAAGHSASDAFAAWSFSVTGIVRDHLELARGGALDLSGARWAPAAAIAVTLLTLATTVYSMRRGRSFEAWLGIMVTAASLTTLWSITRIVEPITDYQVLPATALGAMALGIVLSFVPALRADENRRRQGAARLAAIVMCAAVVILASVHVRRAVALQQRLPWAADVVPAVARIEAYLDERRSRAAVVDVDRVWSQTVPIVLRLRQHHRRISVTRDNLFMFTEAFAPTGREDTRLTIQPGRIPVPPGSVAIFDSWTISVFARD